MIKLNVYLNFPGNAEEAFAFYRSVFGGVFSSVVRFKDMPMAGSPLPEEARDLLMHIALPVGQDMLMGDDAPESLGKKVVPGNNVYLSVHPDGKEEADRVFRALAAGGKIEMAISDQPWGDYYGSLTDKFGIRWMVNYSYPRKG